MSEATLECEEVKGLDYWKYSSISTRMEPNSCFNELHGMDMILNAVPTLKQTTQLMGWLDGVVILVFCAETEIHWYHLIRQKHVTDIHDIFPCWGWLFLIYVITHTSLSNILFCDVIYNIWIGVYICEFCDANLWFSILKPNCDINECNMLVFLTL